MGFELLGVVCGLVYGGIFVLIDLGNSIVEVGVFRGGWVGCSCWGVFNLGLSLVIVFGV